MSLLRIAAFDVDGTLTRRDCVVPFIRKVAGMRSVVQQLALGARHTLPAVVRRDRDRLKALGTHAAFAGRDVNEVQQLADVFAAEVFATGLRPDKWSAMSRHAAAGDQVVLVSASFEVYLRPLAELLGAHGVLAVRLETDGDTFTGNLFGPNCRGPEKVRRLNEWLDEHHGGRANVHVTAYGDSAGDRELLLDSDTAVYVGSGSPAWLPAANR
ncbi:MAG: phosphatidylglycerophosphatase C [Candidatus Azotimanducaceae bacterium]|mgnify:FL=1|jgi:phosphatidylglycerophosphatase C